MSDDVNKFCKHMIFLIWLYGLNSVSAQSIYQKGHCNASTEKFLKKYSFTENITVLSCGAKNYFFCDTRWKMQKILQILKKFLIPDKFWESLSFIINGHIVKELQNKVYLAKK